jgi:hypothetical protein
MSAMAKSSASRSGCHVEAAADPDVLGDGAQTHRHHQEVGDQFRAFGLEMMLGHPEGVVAAHTREVKGDQVQPIGITRLSSGNS